MRSRSIGSPPRRFIVVDMQVTPEVERIVAEQRRWAQSTGRTLNQRGTGFGSRDEALIAPLPGDVVAQLAAAPGGELGRIHSFRSSSALAMNVFLPWTAGPTPVAGLLGGTGQYDRVAFEQEFDTGVSSPYLDVVIGGGNVLVAVESKFVEPYDDHPRSVFSGKYFMDADTWVHFPDLERLASRFSKADGCFERLDAAQLLKHAMGLINEHGPEGFELVYLWYDVGGPRAAQHRSDLAGFAAMTADSFSFRSMTYQDLFAQLLTLDEPVDGYRAYLAQRYFPEMA